MTAPLNFPLFYAEDSNGLPLAGGLLYTYAAGGSTPLASYTDYAGTVPNTNPVILDANGKAPIWLGSSSYKLVLKNSSGVTQWTVDNYMTELASLSDTAAGNGDALIGVKSSSTGGTARTQHDKNADYLTPEDFGCDPTGSVACHTALQAAIDAAITSGQTLVGRGTYLLEGDVTARLVALDFSGAILKINDATSIVTIGGSSAVNRTPVQRLGYVYRVTSSTTVPSLRVRGTKSGLFQVQECDYMQIYADTNTATGGGVLNGSIAYCDFRLGYVPKLDLTTPGTTDGSTIQWINENNISLTRCKVLTIDGTYGHNHNIITGGSFEGEDAYIFFNVGTDNKILDCRWETLNRAWTTSTAYAADDRVSSGGLLYKCLVAHTSGIFATDLSDGKWVQVYIVTFASATRNNQVHVSWTSSSNTLLNISGQGALIGYVSYKGTGNHVINDEAEAYTYATVSSAGVEDEYPDTLIAGQPLQGRTVTLQRLMGGSGAIFARSDYLPVLAGDIFRWFMFDTAGSYDVSTCDYYRTKIQFYDALLRPVTPDATAANWIDTLLGSFETVSGSGYVSSSNHEKGALQIKNAAITAGVRYARVSSVASGATSASTECVHMEIAHGRSKKHPFFGPSKGKIVRSDAFLVSAIPTQGYCSAGKIAIKSDGSDQWVNRFAAETVTLNDELALSTSIELPTGGGTGSADNDVIGINLNNGTTHWTTISSGGGTDIITIPATGLSSAAAAGSRVVFQRWTAFT